MKTLSPHAARILKLFLEDTSKQRYGTEIVQRLNMQSGTVYPLLDMLRNEGYLVAEWEPKTTEKLGRPPRRMYRLTFDGAAKAVTDLMEMSELYRPPTSFGGQ